MDRRELRVETTASSTPELADESWAAQRADAFVAMAKAYLGGSGEGEASVASGTSDHYQVHIEHWSTGGETSLANLVLLCSHTSGEASRVAEPSAEVYPSGRAIRPSAEVYPFTLWRSAE